MANDLGVVLIYGVNVACPDFWIGKKMYETMMSPLSCIPTLKKTPTILWLCVVLHGLHGDTPALLHVTTTFHPCFGQELIP